MIKKIGSVLLVVAVMAGCATDGDVQRGKAADYNAQLGLNYMAQGKDELAMDKLKKALEFNPKQVSAHHYMAELYRRLGRPKEADEHYRGTAI